MLADVANKLKHLGLKFAEQSAVTFSIFDILHPENKEQIIADGDTKVRSLLNNWYKGFYSNEEKSALNQTIWFEVDSEIQKRTKAEYSKNKTNNYFMLADSGARGSFTILSYLSGMR